MSFYRTNRNAPRTNKATFYISGHDVSVEFSLIVQNGEPQITILEVANTGTHKDAGLPDDLIVKLIKEEIAAHGLIIFNYEELP